MDFAIAPARGSGIAAGWEVLCLRQRHGMEVATRLATFGYRQHAEAFLEDLLGMSRSHVEPAEA